MTPYLRSVAAVIVQAKDGKILLGLKAPGGVFHNLWQLPGGGVESCETLEQAARREVLEETGIDLEGRELELVDDQGCAIASRPADGMLYDMRFSIFRAYLDINSSECRLTPSAEFSQLGWFAFDELSELPLVPAGEELFKRLGFLPE